jgi:hypothetical protein
MPGRVEPGPQKKTLTGGVQPLTMTTFTSEAKRFGVRIESAEVSYTDLPAVPDEKGVPQLLAVFANVIRQDSGHAEKERRPATLGGRPSLIFRLEVNDRNQIIYQLTIKGARLYILAIAGNSRYSINHVRVQRFFKSFEFTD